MKRIILSTLEDLGENECIKLKKLKKIVFKSADNEDEDEFNDAIEKLKSKGKITIDDDDRVSLSTEKSNTSTKKRKLDPEFEKNEDVVIEDHVSEPVAAKSETKTDFYEDLWKNGEKYYRDGSFTYDYNRTNPDGITRIFCGNLNKKVTEEQLKQCIDGIMYIKWITDKTTKEFYGSTFLEMRDPQAAITAVLQDGNKFLGRPLKVYYCPPKPGDVWPPLKFDNGGSGGQGGGGGGSKFNKEKTPKPIDGKKLFVGNLSYDIDDDMMVTFFKECGELVGLRWLTNQSTGEFRGGGYIEFASSREADAAFALDGKPLMGRPIRIDWTE